MLCLYAKEKWGFKVPDIVIFVQFKIKIDYLYSSVHYPNILFPATTTFSMFLLNNYFYYIISCLQI